MCLLRKITYGEFSEFVQEKKLHIAVIGLKMPQFFFYLILKSFLKKSLSLLRLLQRLYRQLSSLKKMINGKIITVLMLKQYLSLLTVQNFQKGITFSLSIRKNW